MKYPVKRWLAGFCLAAATACSDDPAPKPASTADADAAVETLQDTVATPLFPLELDQGGARLDFDPSGPALVLSYGASEATAARTRLRLDRLHFGRVKAFDKNVNYSPTNLSNGEFDGFGWDKVIKVAQVTKLPVEDGIARRIVLDVQLAHGGSGTVDVLVRSGLATTGLPAPGFHLEFKLANDPIADSQHGQPAPVIVGVDFEVPKDERFYGLGELFDTPQHRGQVRAMHIEADGGVDSGYNEAHVPVNLLVGTRGWGVFVDSRDPGQWDVAKSDPTRVTALYNAPRLSFWLFATPRAVDVPLLYTKLTGAPALPARWAIGGLIWRNENASQQEVLDDMKAVRDHDLALSGMWLDRPYDSHVNDFGFDPQKFPNPPAMLQAVRAAGLRMGLWSTPYLEKGAVHQKTAQSNGYFVGVPAVVQGFLKWGPPIDFTNPAADQFWRGLIKQYADFGIEGYKLDFAEDVHPGLANVRVRYTFHDGSDERTMHHGYAPLYHRPYAESLPKDGGFILARAGTHGDQVYSSMIWPGDLCANWSRHRECDKSATCHAGGLPAAVSAMLSLSTSGYPLFGSDTGGYRHGRAPKELFIRWLQHTALSPVLQIGGSKHHNPWDFAKYGDSQFDVETLAVARQYIRLHARLFPALWTDLLDARAGKRLGPVVPIGLAHPELAAMATDLDAVEADEYLLAQDLLAAPITRPESKRRVLFPQGKWWNWFTHEVLDASAGATAIDVTVPLDKMPLWLRAGSVLPLLRPGIDTLAPATLPGVDSFADSAGWLHVVVARGGVTSKFVYDGTILDLTDFVQGTSVAVLAGKEFVTGVAWEVWTDVAPKSVGTRKKQGEATKPLPEQPDAGKAAVCDACWRFDPATKTLTVRWAFPPGDTPVGIGAAIQWP
jgi:alpha-D-xyloside xylohydrolase